MRKLAMFTMLLAITSCADRRCSRDQFYCLPSQDQNKVIKQLDDRRLVALAEIDRELSHPPSNAPIYELRARGQDKAKNAYYYYGREGNQASTLDSMTRIFSEDWPVCDEWTRGSSGISRKRLEESCFRVFEKTIDLNDAMQVR